MLFTVTIAKLSPYFQSTVANSSFSQVQTGDMNPIERVKFKLFDDRAVIWSAAIEDIEEGHYVVKPSGRPMIMDHPKWGFTEWTHGMHNTPLHLLKNLRLLSGTTLLLIFCVVWRDLALSLGTEIPVSYKVISLSVLVTFIVGGTAEHYIFGSDISFFFLALSGIIVGEYRRVKNGVGQARPRNT